MKMRWMVCVGLLAAAPLSAQRLPPVPVESFRLDNGLEVILVPDDGTQVVATEIWYDVGSRNERPGLSGFAHLFEHMMFQGSANVAKMEHFEYVQREGGTLNGTTNEDRTNYYNVLPSNQLPLALWLEADRMRSLAVSQENLDNQRNAIKEEIRLKVENPPYAGALQAGLYGLYDADRCFPYGHSIFGSMDDLDAATLDDVREFHRTYYAPNNARLAITGNFDPAEARALVRRYFSDIPAGPEAPPVAACEYRLSPGAERRHVHDPAAALPAVMQFYRVPEFSHPDYPALELLQAVLGQGGSSRLNLTVVREQQLAQSAAALLNPAGPRRGPGALLVLAVANAGVEVEALDASVSEQLRRIAAEGVAPEELERVRNSLRAETIRNRQQPWLLGGQVQHARTFLGDPGRVNELVERMDGVTAADLQRVARTYLVPENGLILLVSSKES